MSYRLINGRAYSLGNIEPVEETQKVRKVQKNNSNENIGKSFKDILNETLSNDKSFTISKHAALRFNEMSFTKEDMKAVEEGFEKAKEKNSKNAVIIYKDTAVVASIENRTIITAVNKERAKDNIFTNIDSVVIL